MDDIEGNIGMLSYRYDSVNSLSLHRLRPRKVVPFRSRNPLCHQLLLVLRYDISVLGMDYAQSSKVPRNFKCLIHGNIVQSEHVVVGHEKFKALNSIFYHSLHIVNCFLIPVYYGCVETIIAVYLRVSPSSPCFVGLSHGSPFAGNCKIDERSSSSSDGCLRPGVKVVLGVGAHKRELHVGVGIDSSRDEKLAGAVNNISIFVGEAARESSYFSVLDEDIGSGGDVGVDNSCVFEEIGAEISEDRPVDQFVHRYGYYAVVNSKLS